MGYELGIIGAGNMAEAIARGVIAAGVIPAAGIIASDVSEARRELFKGMGAATTSDNVQAANSRMVLLSVKPQQMNAVLAALGGALPQSALVISIAAGISSQKIERALGEAKRWRVIRSMPNTPMLVGEGMVAVSRGRNATADDVSATTRLFRACGDVLELPEEKMDAVTAISGSGPAYFYYLVEQMIAAGVELGLTADQAHRLATRTAVGAAKLLTASSDAPAELRRKVTSPNGTTQAAIETMEAKGVGMGIVQAVKRAAARSEELGR